MQQSFPESHPMDSQLLRAAGTLGFAGSFRMHVMETAQDLQSEGLAHDPDYATGS